MRLILHMVAKDFVMLRGRLAVWLAVMAAKFVLGAYLLLGAKAGDNTMAELQMAVPVLSVADVALMMLLAAVLVQEDGVAGTPAFWRTRPIAGGRLLAAKIVGALLLFVAPALAIAVPWWWVCGLAAGQAATAALEMAMLQVIILTVAVWAASVTTTLGRSLVWGIVTVVGANVVITTRSYWWPGFAGGQGQVYLGAVLGLWVTLGVVAVVQFLTRRRNRALVVMGAGFLVSLLGIEPLLLSVSWTSSAKEPATTQSEKPGETITVGFVSAQVQSRTTRRRTGEYEYLSLRFQVENLPAGQMVGSGQAHFRWVGADGNSRQATEYFGGTSVWGVATGLVRNAQSWPGEGVGLVQSSLFSGMSMPERELAHLRERPTALGAEFRFHVLRPQRLFETPLGRGSWRTGHGRGARVIRVGKTDTGLRAELIETEPFSFTGEFRQSLRRPQPTSRGTVYVMRDPGRDVTDTQTGSSLTSVFLGGVRIGSRALSLWVPENKRGALTAADLANGLEGVSLTAVGFPVVGECSRTIEVPADKFKIAK